MTSQRCHLCGSRGASGPGGEGRLVPGKYTVWGGRAGRSILVTISAAATGGLTCEQRHTLPCAETTVLTLWLLPPASGANCPGRSSSAQTSARARPRQLPGPFRCWCWNPGSGRRGKGNETPQHWATENNHCLFKGRLCPVPRQELSVSPPFSSC